MKRVCEIVVFVFSTKGHLTAVDYMFKKYIEKLRTHDPACPLCHRPFDEQTEVDELISEARTYCFHVSTSCVTFVIISVLELLQNLIL